MQWDRNKVIFQYLSYCFYGLSLLSLFITIFSYKSPTNIQKSIPIVIFILAVIFKILESYNYKKMKESVLEMKRDQAKISKIIINAINSPQSSYKIDKFPHPYVVVELKTFKIESTIDNTFFNNKGQLESKKLRFILDGEDFNPQITDELDQIILNHFNQKISEEIMNIENKYKTNH